MLGARRARDFFVLWAGESLTSAEITSYCTAGECLQEAFGLHVGIHMPDEIATYDLLYDTGVLRVDDHRVIEDRLSKVYRIIRDGTFLWNSRQSNQRFSDHPTAHIAAMASIGYIMERADTVQEAIFGGKPACRAALP